MSVFSGYITKVRFSLSSSEGELVKKKYDWTWLSFSKFILKKKFSREHKCNIKNYESILKE